MPKNSHPFDPYWLSASFLPTYEWLHAQRTSQPFHELDRARLARHFLESGCIQWFFAADTWHQLDRQDARLDLKDMPSSLQQTFADGALYYLSASGLGLEESLLVFCRLWNHIHGYVKLAVHQDASGLRIESHGARDLCTDLELDFWLALIASFLARSPMLGETKLVFNSRTSNRLKLDHQITQQGPASITGLQLHTAPCEKELGYDEFFLDAAIESFVFSLKPSMDMLYQASQVFLQDPAVWPDIEAFASINNMTTRSLQRRLQELGLNYSALIDIHRRERAHLLARYHSPANIADLLGYHEVTSYAKAFNRWYD